MFIRKVGIFSNTVALRRNVSSFIQTPASLKILIKHAGREGGDGFQRVDQKRLLKESIDNGKDFRIPHAACEININLNDPKISSSLREITKSLLVESDRYNEAKEKGGVVSGDILSKIISSYDKASIDNLNLYLSWYPGDDSVSKGAASDFLIESAARLENEVMRRYKNLAPSPIFNPANSIMGMVLGKQKPSLGTKKNDRFTDIEGDTETIVLHDVDYESILKDLNKIVIFGLREGVVEVIAAKEETSYYLLALLRDHVSLTDADMMSPDHVCSTLAARVLRQAIGAEKYANFVHEAKQLLGHQRAYPELIYEVAKLAKREEVIELATKTVIQPK